MPAHAGIQFRAVLARSSRVADFSCSINAASACCRTIDSPHTDPGSPISETTRSYNRLHMSQVVLGLRSLTIKLAIFFVMAALLAWALGGTLFPKPYVVDLEDRGVTVAGTTYFWRLSVEDRDDARPQWQFMMTDGKDETPVAETFWVDAAGPVLADGGPYFAGRDPDEGWVILRLDGTTIAGRHPMPDRLAVEQQLQRLANGLPLQDASTILAERLTVLDPPRGNADQEESASPASAD